MWAVILGLSISIVTAAALLGRFPRTLGCLLFGLGSVVVCITIALLSLLVLPGLPYLAVGVLAIVGGALLLSAVSAGGRLTP